MRGVRRFFTARLHRRLFFWFLATVFVTSGTVFAVLRVAEQGDATSWSQRLDRMRAFAGRRFSLVWDDPAGRDELASSVSRDLDLDVTLQDAEGHVIGNRSSNPCRGGAFVVPVRRGERSVGRVLLCTDRHRAPSWSRIALPFATAFGMLWLASGILARRLSRPMEELARNAVALGRGRRPSLHEGKNDPVEVQAVSTVMDDLAARIQKQLQDQRALLAAVSHEIRTPLARMRLLVELARGKFGEDRAFDDVDREVTDVDALVSELLASSRVDFAALSPKRLDAERVGALALERAGVASDRLQVKGKNLGFQGDPTLVDRAVGNLLRNAEIHGRGVEALRIERSSDGLGISFEVDDRGPGFAPGEEENVFRPFHRPATEPGKEQTSLGLGLSLVRRIAEAHGGWAYAKNRSDGGATVGVTFATGE